MKLKQNHIYSSAVSTILLLSACGGSTPNAIESPEPLPPPVGVKTDISWPLCGHITQNPPLAWSENDGCPVNRQKIDFTDLPLSNTFGPRQKNSENNRYDFHRGIDIPTPAGSPLFAVASGVVTRAGLSDSFSDLGITLRHYDPDTADCDTEDCLSSLYLHMQSVSVTEGEVLSQGQFIGYSGVGASGFEHLHFEFRKAPGSHDHLSAWQRDVIHPLRYLPYPDNGSDNLGIDSVALTNTGNGQLSLQASVFAGANTELDFNRLEIELVDKTTNTPIQQSTELPVGNTPEGDGYFVNPPWYDIREVNRQFTYKDSSNFPWSSFSTGGTFESPYHMDMSASYTANTHLDLATTTNPRVGQFNGVTLTPSQFNSAASEYRLGIEFTELRSTQVADMICVRLRAIDSRDKPGEWQEFNCN